MILLRALIRKKPRHSRGGIHVHCSSTELSKSLVCAKWISSTLSPTIAILFPLILGRGTPATIFSEKPSSSTSSFGARGPTLHCSSKRMLLSRRSLRLVHNVHVINYRATLYTSIQQLCIDERDGMGMLSFSFLDLASLPEAPLFWGLSKREPKKQ